MKLEDKISQPRFLDVATFMQVSYKEDYNDIDIGLVGIP